MQEADITVCLPVGPSERWGHIMCLSDPDTAILIGGEASGNTQCKDALWKLEIDSDFWFPLNCSTSGPALQSAQGHSATFDPGSKALYVYGGLREGQRYSDLYILNTLTWKWKLVTAKGKVPELAYHSATIYRKELFVFGGVTPSHCSGGRSCSNALYIFNPEFELWYQPIVEGGRPLPRYGHSTVLLSNKLIIFGGRKTATYLNDLHVLDLGFMEYTAVKYENMPPLPRGFHAALPVCDDRMLISGGCSTIGALQDLFIYNPRAGHSLLCLPEEEKLGERHGDTQCRLLVFGGSDCAGTFYNNLIKCTVLVPEDEGRPWTGTP
ncbi:RING finger protein B [Aplochiton taeniatus]